MGGNPDFSAWKPNSVDWGKFLTALVAFLVMAFVVYFFIVKPYNAAKERLFGPKAEAGPDELSLLTEIRDELRARNGRI